MTIYKEGDIVIFEDGTTTILPYNTDLTIGNCYPGKKIKDVKLSDREDVPVEYRNPMQAGGRKRRRTKKSKRSKRRKTNRRRR